MSRRATAFFGIGIVVFGVAVFMLASAYLIERDLPKWLAAAVGALAFPVLPVGWHVIGERRRRQRLAAAKTQPKTTLAPGDRYLMRAVAVAILALAPMFVVGRFAVVRAAWNHKTWFIPDPSYDAIETTDDLFAHLPSDAEALLVIRDHDEKRTKSDKPKLGVIAYSDGQLAMIAPDDGADQANPGDKVAELDKQRSKIPFLKIGELDTVKLGKGMFAVATERWRTPIREAGSGPRAALRTELSRAPADAMVSLAYVPNKPVDLLGIQKMTGWMLQKATNEKLTIEAQIDCVDAASAGKALDLMRALWKTQQPELPEKCRDELSKVTDKVELQQTGAKITFRLVIEPEQLAGLMLCGMKNAKLED
jgi:hypothetical protein